MRLTTMLVANFSEAEFGRWLADGLRAMHSPASSSSAFSGTEIDIQEPITPQLLDLFDALPSAKAQWAFKDGIRHAIQILVGHRWIPLAFADCAQLAGYVQAVSALPYLHSLLQSGSFRPPACDDYQLAHMVIWNAIASMAPNPSAVEMIRARYNEPDCPPELFKLFFFTLCSVNFENIAGELRRFVQKMGREWLEAENWVAFSYSLLGNIGIGRLANQMQFLSFQRKTLRQSQRLPMGDPNDLTWFLKALFGTPDMPMELLQPAEVPFRAWSIRLADAKEIERPPAEIAMDQLDRAQQRVLCDALQVAYFERRVNQSKLDNSGSGPNDPNRVIVQLYRQGDAA